MRDKKDNATLDMVGFDGVALAPGAQDSNGAIGAIGATVAPAPARAVPRARNNAPRQHQLELLDATDASGLPVWQRDEGLDITGLPVWASA